MTRLDPARLQRTTRDIVEQLASDPSMAAELARARREFHGHDGAAQQDEELADSRFCEWFVTERESDVLGDVPVRVVGGVPPAVRTALLDSVCSVYLVEQAAPEVRLLDVVTGAELGMEPRDGLGTGDLIAGRLYPGDGDLLAPSPLVAVFHQAETIAAALRSDLARAGVERPLTQAEVEAAIFRAAENLPSEEPAADEPGTERLEADLSALLAPVAEGLELSATDISRALAAETEGPGAVIGPLLEELAFETDIDLGVLQRTLVDLWNAHRREAGRARVSGRRSKRRAKPESKPAADAPGLGAQVAQRLADGLEANEDVDALFSDLEAMLGDETDQGDEAGESEDVAAVDGDLEALVVEYLWERGQHPDSAPAVALRELTMQLDSLPVPVAYLESVPASELGRFLLQAYLSGPPGQRGARVSARFAVLEDFYAWAVETQEYELEATIEACRRDFADPLARTARASLALSTATEVVGTHRPAVHRVLRIEAGEVEVVGDQMAPVWLDVPEVASMLRVGDIVLTSLCADEHGGAKVDGIAVVLPGGASDLIG